MIKSRIDEIGTVIESARASIEPPSIEDATDAFLRRFVRRPSEPPAPPPLVRVLSEEGVPEPISPGDAVADDPAQPYQVFTREFDEVIEAEEFLIGKSGYEFSRYVTTLAGDISKKHRGTLVKFERDLEEFRATRSASVTLLIDNSGSLRGARLPIVSAWCLKLAEIFDDAGCETEVLGFTTRAWKGGQSRQKWMSEGRPPRPGRLNDLRYIVYKDFSRSFVECVQNFGVMMQEGILKENIDGEAIEFATSRLSQRPSDLRVLIVVSDGSPMDDSTAHENGAGYLQRHLRQVIEANDPNGIKLMAVGINRDVASYYGKATRTSAPERLGIDVMNLARSQLAIPLRKTKKASAAKK